VVLIVLPAQGNAVRFGVTAGKTVGKAVRRNRVKRRIRNAILSFLPFIKPGWDVIIIARKQIVDATFEQIRSTLLALLFRAGIIAKNDNGQIE
jgi:ribonuclease P protein component